jgi:hypothetical protein
MKLNVIKQRVFWWGISGVIILVGIGSHGPILAAVWGSPQTRSGLCRGHSPTVNPSLRLPRATCPDDIEAQRCAPVAQRSKT